MFPVVIIGICAVYIEIMQNNVQLSFVDLCMSEYKQEGGEGGYEIVLLIQPES